MRFENLTGLKPKPGDPLRFVSLVFASAIVMFVGWVILFGAMNLAPHTLSDTMATSKYVHPEKATEIICAEYECDEAWYTDVGTFMRFESERKAEYIAYLLGDQCRRNGTIVLDFGDSKMSLQQKVDAISLLFPGKDWY